MLSGCLHVYNGVVGQSTHGVYYTFIVSQESCNQSLQIIATYGVYSVMLLCDMELDYVKCLIRVQCKVTSL